MKGYARVVTGLCRAYQWPVPVEEHRFAPPRKWRFDLAWPADHLACEIQGATFSGGRHTRGAGLLLEYEKLNAAALGGWRVLLIVPGQVTDGTLTTLLTTAFEPRPTGVVLVRPG